MRIAVCDDSKLFLEEIGEQLRRLGMVESLHVYSDQKTFLKSVEDGNIYDAVLMDIDWRQEKTGMDIAEQLYIMLPHAKIIYVTGYNDRFSQHVFLHRVNLCGYLVKPVDPEILAKNLRKAEKLLSLENDGGLFLNVNGSMVHVLFHEIIYIESRDHVVTVHTAAGAVSAYVPLRQILQQLPGGFYQCHKSYVVNLRQIRRFQYPDILMKNGGKVPVSRSRYKEAKETYFRFMGDFC